MSKITINIDFDTGAVDINNPSSTGQKTNTDTELKTFKVESRYLLYKLADNGLLESLVAVEYSQKLKRNVWIFKETPDVRDVYTKFFEEKKAEKRMKKEKNQNEVIEA